MNTKQMRDWVFLIERDGEGGRRFQVEAELPKDPGAALMELHRDLQNSWEETFVKGRDAKGREQTTKQKRVVTRWEPDSYQVVNASAFGISYPEFAKMSTPDLRGKRPTGKVPEPRAVAASLMGFRA